MPLTVPRPRGAIAAHSLTTTFTTSGTHTTYQDEGLTLTVDDIAGRRYLFSVQLNLYVPGGANLVRVKLLRDGVQVRLWEFASEVLAVGALLSATRWHQEVIAAAHAASVYKLQIHAGTNNTSVASYGDASNPRQLLIEEIGV